MTDITLFNQPEFVVHQRETTTQSETYLEANRERLSKNCKILFDLLMQGVRVNSNNSPVGDFRARVGDLWRVNGVKLHNEKIRVGSATLKEWWMDEEDKIFNKKFVVLK